MSDIRDAEISVGTIITIVSVLGIGAYAVGVASLAKNMTFQPNIRVHRINGEGILLHADVDIVNPTNATITIQQPNIQVFEGKVGRLPITSTIPSAKTYEVNKQGVTKIEGISLPISWTDLLLLIAQMKKNGFDELKLLVQVQARVSGRYFLAKTIKKVIELPIVIPKAILNNL